MSLPEEINELDFNDDIFTPEMFAWKLLLDDCNRDALSSQLQTFTDTYDTEDDPITFFFEIALTICMELIYGVLKLNFYAEHDDGKEFKHKLVNADIDNVLPMINNKFAELHLQCSIYGYDNDDYFKEYCKDILNHRYCRIILRHNKNDKKEFKLYADNIDDDKPYHMILNGKYDTQSKLKEVYATFSIENKIYKVSFDKIALQPKPLTINDYVYDGVDTYECDRC
jgi:hypothetical protein